MREIKFRAWQHVDKVMLFADINELEDLNGEWTAWDLPIDSPTNTGTPLEVMQFTGLKDDNGVDTYEDDLCSVYNLGVCVVKMEPLYGVTFHQLSKSKGIHTALNCAQLGIEFVVIGNIHENAEFLK